MGSCCHPIVLGIVGGNGAGKTFIALKLHERFLPARCQVIAQDSCFRGLPSVYAIGGGQE